GTPRAAGEETGPPAALGLFGTCAFFGRVLEVPDASPDAAADLWQAVRAEDQDDDGQNDQQLGDAYVAHVTPSAAIVPRGCGRDCDRTPGRRNGGDRPVYLGKPRTGAETGPPVFH